MDEAAFGVDAVDGRDQRGLGVADRMHGHAIHATAVDAHERILEHVDRDARTAHQRDQVLQGVALAVLRHLNRDPAFRAPLEAQLIHRDQRPVGVEDALDVTLEDLVDLGDLARMSVHGAVGVNHPDLDAARHVARAVIGHQVHGVAGHDGPLLAEQRGVGEHNLEPQLEQGLTESLPQAGEVDHQPGISVPQDREITAVERSGREQVARSDGEGAALAGVQVEPVVGQAELALPVEQAFVGGVGVPDQAVAGGTQGTADRHKVRFQHLVGLFLRDDRAVQVEDQGGLELREVLRGIHRVHGSLQVITRLFGANRVCNRLTRNSQTITNRPVAQP